MKLALRARVLRFGRGRASPWETAVWLTGGLLCGRPPQPPYFLFTPVARQHDLPSIQLRASTRLLDRL